jgi:hypothetical protein
MKIQTAQMRNLGPQSKRPKPKAKFLWAAKGKISLSRLAPALHNSHEDFLMEMARIDVDL